MNHMNSYCTDVGTVNCPCSLAETGDCLICSRLAGEEHCDCPWAGVCIYNEYIQNDKIIRNRRRNEELPILKKIWYGSDLLVIVIKASKGFAMQAMRPGSFVFVNCRGKSEFCNVPISVLKADVENERLYLVLKVISAKTKNIAAERVSLMVRGVYRNGFLGKGVQGLVEDVKGKAGSTQTHLPVQKHLSEQEHPYEKKKWLIITKGVGFAPAVNLLKWADSRVDAELLIDTEKVGHEIIRDYLAGGLDNLHSSAKVSNISLKEMAADKNFLCVNYPADNFDKVIILASDHYIKTLTAIMDIQAHKLVFSNNFHMCCGEGICGACVHIDKQGDVRKMCKCKEVDADEL